MRVSYASNRCRSVRARVRFSHNLSTVGRFSTGGLLQGLPRTAPRVLRILRILRIPRIPRIPRFDFVQTN